MRFGLQLFGLVLCAAIPASTPAAAVKKVPYPEVRVVPLPAFPGDEALTELRKRFAAAVSKEDVDGLVRLLAPAFSWTIAGSPSDEFDPQRGAEHNFKVAFGFRAVGRDSDGPTDIGPQWDMLRFFATDEILTQEEGSPLVCGSHTARLEDLATLQEAFDQIDEEDDISEWVYSASRLTLTAKPGGGARVANVNRIALPITDVYPSAANAKQTRPTTHFELLLPSGRTGWAPVRDLRPLFADRLCFTRIDGTWRIAVYDQGE